MSLFHRHRWRLTSVSFNPRPEGIRNIKSSSNGALLKAAYGFTVITQECAKCGLIRTETTAGQA